MGNFQFPSVTALDGAGITIPGAKLYFYETLTSTPLATYQDEANTIPNTNPVIADADGVFPEIFLQTDEAYKVVFKNASDITLHTWDPVNAYGYINTFVPDRIKQIASNPLDYGAVGDGVANEVVAVQDAIDNSTGTIDLLGLTYRCDSSITLPADRRLVNGTLDFSLCTDPSCIKTANAAFGTTIPLTADATLGDTTLTITSTATLAAGDWLILRASNVWEAGYPGISEPVRVRTVDSGTQITLDSRLRMSYLASNSAQVFRITQLNRIHIKDVRVLGSNASAQRGIYIQNGYNCTIESTEVKGVQGSGITLRNCIDTYVSDCSVRDCVDATSGNAYELLDSCFNVVIDDCAANDIMRGVYIKGENYIAHNTHAAHCSISGGRTAGAVIDIATKGCSVKDCVIFGAIESNCAGIQAFGDDCEVTCNTIRGVGGLGIEARPSGPEAISAGGSDPALAFDNITLRISGNNIMLCGETGIYVAGTNGSIYGCQINGNLIGDCGSGGIVVGPVGSSNTIQSLSVDNNTFNWRVSTGVAINLSAPSGTGTAFSMVSVSNNRLDNVPSASIGIYLDSGGRDYSNVSVCGNVVKSGATGISIKNASNLKCNANIAAKGIILAFTGTGTKSNLSIDGNAIDTTTADGIALDWAAASPINVSVSNNRVKSAGAHAIKLTGTTGDVRQISVSGNTLDDPATSGVYAETSGAGAIDGLTVNNNTINSPGANGVHVVRSSTGAVRSLSLSGNAIDTPAANGIYCVIVEGANIASNSIKSSVASAIRADNSSRVSISSNTTNSCSGGVLITADDAGTHSGFCVSSNLLHGCTGDGIVVSTGASTTLGNVFVSANNVSECAGNGIEFSSAGIITLFSISANIVSLTGTTVPCLLFSGAGGIGQFTAMGNFFHRGTIAMDSTVSGVIEKYVVGSNVFYGQSVSALGSGMFPVGYPAVNVYIATEADAQTLGGGDFNVANPDMDNLPNIKLL